MNLGMFLEEVEGLGYLGPDVKEANRIVRQLQLEFDLVKEVVKAEASLDAIEVERTLSKARVVGLKMSQRLDALGERLGRLWM